MTSFKVKFTHYLLSVGFLLLSLSLLAGIMFYSSLESFMGSALLSHSITNASVSITAGFLLSYESMLFASVVCLVTSVVLVFALAYMSQSYNYVEFLTLLVLFVLSMLFVVFLNDLLTVMVGWDGLGVISFFLIVFYQSPLTVFSGWFTLLMNRVGDSLLIVSIVLMWYFDPLSGLFFASFSSDSIVCVCVVLSGLMTKSALFPFSPWLPVAMSAPTPISALVHSSTLVTAGLYLMMRFEYLIFSTPDISLALLVLSLFTSFYAGLGALFEVDLKKLVALSTLSHLGFIGLGLSMGATSLAFFHLLVHALFKSLLFMGVGDWMISGHHFQDARQLSAGLNLTPFSSLVVLSSLLSLLGFPFMSGFYSKDYILEFGMYTSMGVVLLVVMYTNVMLTFIYTLRATYYILSNVAYHSPYFLVSSFSYVHFPCLVSLSIVSFFFPTMYSLEVNFSPLTLPPLLHFFPFMLLITLTFLCVTSYLSLKTSSSSVSSVAVSMTTCFSSMLYLSSVYSAHFSGMWFRLSNSSVVALESSALGSMLFMFPASFLHSSSNYSSNFLSSLFSLLPILLVFACVVYAMLWVGTLCKFSFES